MEHFYKNIQGWFRFKKFYDKAVKQAPQSGAHFVEVGCWKGKSTAYMAVEILNSGKNIRFSCVDTWEGSDEPAHHKDPDIQAGRLYEVFLRNLAPVKDVIEPMRITSVEAAEQFEDESLDFVLIDAAHDYENVIADLRSWWPKLKPGGVMAGDDFRWGGVNKAYKEFFGSYEEINKKGIERDFVLNDNKEPVCWSVRKPE